MGVITLLVSVGAGLVVTAQHVTLPEYSNMYSLHTIRPPRHARPSCRPLQRDLQLTPRCAD